MTTNFGKLDKFEGHDFRRWQKKMHFLLTTLKVVYVLTTPMPDLVEDATVEAIRIRAKWENDDYICRGHILDFRSGNKKNANAGGSGKGSKTIPKTKIDFGATTHVCKDRCWFKTYEPEEDGYVLYMGDDHFALVHGKGSVVLEFSSGKSITLFNVLYVPKLRIIHETTTPYTPHQNGVAERKYRALKEMVNSMLSYSSLIEGFWGEAMLTFWDDHCDDVPSETPEPRRGHRARKAKSYGSDFQLYLVEGSRDQVGSQYSYCYSYVENPRTYNEAMQSRDAAFWKKAIDDEIGSIMENNTQKEGIDYFDTYAPVARITTIRLLLALATIHNLVIHQMDVKTAFLNGDLDEEVYMKQPEGFVMPGNEHKVCKLVKSFKFDSSGKGVIICLYVDDMLIFGTDQNQVDKTKKFLSSRFSMKDMGEADVILGIKIKRENKGIVITRSHYIKKILKKFNHEDFCPVSTPMDPVEKLKPNTGKPVDQLEYSRAIGCLMYAMTSNRLDIAYVVGRLKAYSDTSWINHVEDSSSTSGWVILLEGGVISWASKKQTCITRSTMESEFVPLAATCKEAEWLRNLIHEIPIGQKPIAPISI
ncbi:zinc finger, CCHC-type containing protein [Tanacetum coccineum]